MKTNKFFCTFRIEKLLFLIILAIMACSSPHEQKPFGSPYKVSQIDTTVGRTLNPHASGGNHVSDSYRVTEPTVREVIDGVPGLINVKAYGAAGDGATDDTSAIEDAISAAQAAGGARLFFPEGSYAVTGITIPQNDNGKHLELYGGRSAKLIAHPSMSDGDFLLTIDGSYSDRTYWVTIRNLMLDGDLNTVHGLRLMPCNYIILEDVYLLDIAGCAIEMIQPQDVYCTRVRVISCGDASNSSTIDASTIMSSQIKIIGHPFRSGERIRYKKGMTNPAGLLDVNPYYVKKIDGDTIELYKERNLDNQITLTGAGSGTATFKTAETAVVIEPDSDGLAGNFVQWTDCNIEAFVDGGLYIAGLINFFANGGKIHGIKETSTGPLIETQGAKQINFTNMLFTSAGDFDAAIFIRDKFAANDRPGLWGSVGSIVGIHSCWIGYSEHTNYIDFDCGQMGARLHITGTTFAATKQLDSGSFLRMGKKVRPHMLSFGAGNNFLSYDESTRMLNPSDYWLDESHYTIPLPGSLSAGSVVNVRDHGATGDGTTDDEPAITAAISAAANTTLYFPLGIYNLGNKVTIAENIRVILDPGVSFIGSSITSKGYALSTFAVETSERKVGTGKYIKINNNGKDYYQELLDAPISELTIASGIVTIPNDTDAVYAIDTESDAVSDDLDSFGGTLSLGRIITIYPANPARTVVVKHSESLMLNGQTDFIMDSASNTMMLLSKGSSVLVELSRSTSDTP